ncbi:YjgB family protein [Bacillus cereus]|uniref:YjgB family protein n=1 Tax=Bacillus cereus TaxID=1396 RepID=UPI0018F4B891|nr:YjgB family protein [Bacillus cereus]MBJ7936920.1 YjgB family protein [Bacillus cereus]
MMKIYLKIVMLFLVFTCMFALAVCKGTDEKNETNPTLENNKNKQSNSSEEQKNLETKPSNEKTTKPSTEPDSKNRTFNQKSINHVKDLFELAKEGKVPNVPFGAHTGDIEEIEKAWGKANKTEQAGNGMYATFTNKNVVFGFNKGSQVFDVRSYHAELKSITLQEIEKALGKPSSVKGNGGDKIYVYKVNNQYELKFVIPKSTGNVDHISVFSPEDSINKMAG